MVLSLILLTASALLVTASLLPFWQTPKWWVRALEFPRFQIGGLALATLIAAAAHRGGLGLCVAALMLVVLAVQAVDIWRYTPLSRKEMRRGKRGDPSQEVVCLAMNVLMENTDHAAVAAEIARVDPDVVFLMETDAGWTEAMAPALAGYAFVLREPLGQHYGLIFATRLHVREARVAYLSVDDTPSVIAEMEAPDGSGFRFVGLHPKPPVPGEDTVGRDAEMAYAARFGRETAMPVVTMGDFNTPAWSQIAHRFKRVGGYLDPRVGRGPMPSFDASRWWLRFPIDQFYATEEVVLLGFERGRYVGSDHFPMIARVRFDLAEAKRLNRRVTDLADDDEARVLLLIEQQGARLAGARHGQGLPEGGGRHPMGPHFKRRSRRRR
jgi:endonuclease/exonuclease/phosphatase (EEP) superfamily protein YafD